MTDPAWRVIVSPRAKRDLRKLDPPTAKRIVRAIERLAEDPLSAHSNLLRLSGRSGYRLRVGEWRVILELDGSERTIHVRQTGPRGNIYER